MAPNVPPEGLMGDPTRMRDDSSSEGSDPARRVARISKSKGVKQSTGVRQEEEPIVFNWFWGRKSQTNLEQLIYIFRGDGVPH